MVKIYTVEFNESGVIHIMDLTKDMHKVLNPVKEELWCSLCPASKLLDTNRFIRILQYEEET